MIKSMHIENYKCFKDFDIEGLGPFNVLVGPNDSGKTALLEAIRILTARKPRQGTDHEALDKELGVKCGPMSVWRQKGSKIRIQANAADSREARGQQFEVCAEGGGDYLYDVTGAPAFPEVLPENWKGQCFDKFVGEVRYYRLDPKALRRPSPVTGKMTETGEGFATFLDDINRTDRTIFRQLEEYFYKRFKHYKTIVIDKTVSQFPSYDGFVDKDCFVLKFRTIHDETLPAEGVSDGVILALALTALCYAPAPVGTLLIEEPENAVHFASLKETVQTLRDIATKKGTQVFATTHCPYLLDLVELNEVWLFNKDEEGAVHARNLADLPEAQDLKDLFMTGEIWTGLDEKKVAAESRGEK